jgi:hypothetical protein
VRSISLMVYAVRVKTIGTRREYQILDSFSDKDADLLEFVKNALVSRKGNTPYRKEDSQQVLQVLKAKANTDGRQIEGLLNIGYYGTATEIRNLEKWTDIAYQKRTSDVDLQPFYFLFDFPEGKDLGLALLQRTGAEGIQSILAEALNESFNRDFNDCRLHMNAYAPEALYRQLEREEVSEVRFIRHRVPRDITTLIGKNSSEETHGTMDVVFRFHESGLRVAAIQRFIDEHRGTDNIFELEETRFRYDNVKIKVKFRGKERTMDLGDPERLRPAFDITEDLKWSPAGHPTFASISNAAQELLSDLKSGSLRKSH